MWIIQSNRQVAVEFLEINSPVYLHYIWVEMQISEVDIRKLVVYVFSCHLGKTDVENDLNLQ